ncbi:MAG: hypothetical protein JXM74_05855, partial [Fusobacteriaceae bacterium]|nr:hypothetical protein [Fusobacteriaceae bacterium]
NRDGTVDESSYSLERALDWVLNNSEPVATVFAENAIEESTQNSESQPNNLNETINISEDNDNDNNNDNEEIKEGKKSMDNKKKVFSFEEKNFRLTVSKLLKEAEEIEDPLEKKDELEDIKEWFEDVDFAPELKQEVEDKLDAVETEIKENAKKGLKTDELSESQKTLKKQVLELSENYTSLDEKFEKATEMLDNMKAYGLKMKELYENQRAKNNGMITAKEYKEAVDYVDTLEKKLKENNEAMKKLSTENKSLRESVDGLKKDLDKKAILEKARLDQINVTKKFNEEKQKANIAKEASNMLEQAKKELVEKEVTSINVRQTDAVKNYYLDLLESNDNYSEYKNQILGCKTILEAQTFVMKLNSSNLVENKKSLKTPIVNVNVSLKENVENDTEEYVFNRKEIRENYKSMSEIMVKGYI